MKTPTHTRRDFLKLAGTSAAALTLARTGVAANAAGKPNVLVILADDLGYGDLSSYGATDLRSPNIDKLVAAGMRFDNFYANCPVCSPTRAALMTGRYPDLVGVPGVIRTHLKDNWGYLFPQAVLLPQMLKRAGYHTALVGKWHLGLAAPNLPNQRGFDHFHGFLGDMMDDYYSHRRHGFNYLRLNDQEINPQGHATDLFTQWAIDYLRTHAAKEEPSRVEGVPPSEGERGRALAQDGNARASGIGVPPMLHGRDAHATTQRGQDARDTRQPFFLYLAYNAPHAPIQPPPEWLERVKQREAGISEKRAKLVALVEHLDAGIGQVMDVLKETGLRDNTLVIFTSDNGGQLDIGGTNGPLRAGKGDMYEGGIREPTCVVWPGKITPGSAAWERRSPDRQKKEGQSGDWRSQADREIGVPGGRVALTMDLFPTICEAAGVQVEHEIDGRSILPTLLGQAQPEDNRTLFWVRREGGARYGGRAYYAARQGDFKLLQNSPFEPMELYNLKDDPKEEKPLGRKHPMYNRLFTALQGHITQAGAVPWQKYPVDRENL